MVHTHIHTYIHTGGVSIYLSPPFPSLSPSLLKQPPVLPLLLPSISIAILADGVG